MFLTSWTGLAFNHEEKIKRSSGWPCEAASCICATLCMALCNETESLKILVHRMASGHDPELSLGMQLEQVKENPVRLGTLTVHNETEGDM